MSSDQERDIIDSDDMGTCDYFWVLERSRRRAVKKGDHLILGVYQKPKPKVSDNALKIGELTDESVEELMKKASPRVVPPQSPLRPSCSKASASKLFGPIF